MSDYKVDHFYYDIETAYPTQITVGQMETERGKGLVVSGIILSIVVQYFVMYPPEFLML